MSKTTKDHNRIRRWAEAREAHPAAVRGTGGRGDPGILRLDFPGYRGKTRLKEISWDEFFDKFDRENLSFLYQEKTKAGNRSNFSKLISADTARRRDTKSARTTTQSARSTKKTAARSRTGTGTRKATGSTPRTPARAKKKTAKATRRTSGTARRKAGS